MKPVLVKIPLKPSKCAQYAIIVSSSPPHAIKGICFAEIAGEVRTYDLKEGEKLKIDPGHIAMFEPKVKYEIELNKELIFVSYFK